MFSNLNLDIYCGEILSIVGNNGSGKSTLLRMTAGLEPVTDGGLFRVMIIKIRSRLYHI